jgi:hypothetical protein
MGTNFTRRSVMMGVAVLVPVTASARGTYCSRHRDACKRRRERWEKMSDEERAEESGRFNAFLKASEEERSRELWIGLQVVAAASAAMVGFGYWLVKGPLKI